MIDLTIETGDKFKKSLLKIQRWCFICGVSTIPVMTGPLKFPIAGNQVAYIFITIGVLTFFIENYIYPNNLTSAEKHMIRFLKVIFLWALLCSVLGVLFYPSFANIDLNQMRSFRNLFFHMKQLYPNLSDLSFLKGGMLYRALRNSIAYAASSYLISFWIYHLYCNDWKRGIRDLKKGILAASILLISYSIIEVGFLCGSASCKAILAKINMKIFDVASGQGWWPPLFWDRLQMRSLFPEPSHLGIFLAMTIPLFFSEFFTKLNKISLFKIFIYCCLVMMLFMSKARTGTVVVGFETILFILCICLCAPLSLSDKFKRLTLLLGCSILAFIFSLGLMSNFKSIDSKVSDSREIISVQDYVQNNVTSITGNQRSNPARYVNALGTLKIGMGHPIFGVGIYTRNEYIAEQLSDADKNVGEVRLWLKYMVEQGPMQSGFPDTNHFITIFAEQGIIGLILFMSPSCVVLLKLLLKKKCIKQNLGTITTSIALIGLNIALLANEDHFGIFIILGLMMAIIWRKEEVQTDEFNN